MKNAIRNGLSILSVLVILGGCATSGDFEPDGGPDIDDQQLDGGDGDLGDGVDVMPLDGDCKPPCEFPRSALDDITGPLAERLIFFEFDKSDIDPKYQELLTNHGKYLASYPDITVRLEGHADERGSREYNLALAEQRAKTVRRILLVQGVPAENISVISFGEEVPLDTGHDEEAWAQNRRVELVYEAN